MSSTATAGGEDDGDDKSEKKPPHPGAKPIKKTEEGMENRRAQVFEMHFLRGYNHETIADSLGVSRKTVGNDIKLIRETLSDQVREGDTVSAVALQMALYDRVLQISLAEMDGTKGKRTRNAFLQTALKAVNSKSNFMINVGLLPSRQQRLDLKVHGEVKVEDVGGRRDFLDIVQDPKRRRKVVSFMERMVGAMGGNSFAELLDVDAKVLPAPADVKPAQPENPGDNHLDEDGNPVARIAEHKFDPTRDAAFDGTRPRTPGEPAEDLYVLDDRENAAEDPFPRRLSDEPEDPAPPEDADDPEFF